MDEASNKTPEKLVEENNFLGELISTTAHSLRTSLSATKWMLQMFLDRDFGELSIEQENMLKKTAENIPKNEQANMFEKFYRATNALEKEPSGSGIGLYTVKKIVLALGGSVDFESSEIGTTFNVLLPKSPIPLVL